MGPLRSPLINQFSAWLEQTPLSEAIGAHSWVVPTVQSIHIMAIALLAGSALMINLRLLGLYAAGQPLRAVAARFTPFIWWSLPVLLITGAIMITGEPPRSLKNPAFQLKMLLLVGAIAITLIGRRRLRAQPAPEGMIRPDGTAVLLAIASIMLWTGIIFAGRWIAYLS